MIKSLSFLVSLTVCAINPAVLMEWPMTAPAYGRTSTRMASLPELSLKPSVPAPSATSTHSR